MLHLWVPLAFVDFVAGVLFAKNARAMERSPAMARRAMASPVGEKAKAIMAMRRRPWCRALAR